MKNMNFSKIMNMAKKNATKASPGKNGGMRDAGELGSPFTNPYTFIPFPDFKNAQKRFEPSLLTADEFDNEKRYTGVLKLEVKTLSPLMTLQPTEKTDTDKTSELKCHKALTIGNDVIVPATSIRGSLRNLMTILTGSALGYLDTNQWLCNLKEKLPKHILPCASEKDGKVDMVTDLFGMVPMEDGTAKAFASRIRCHNLIFKNGKSNLTKDVTLAVLAQPHPGCIAFYRKGNADDISQKSELKGYKVYRNSVDGDCPWKYEVQGVYGKEGKLNVPASGKNTKKVELLEKDSTGTLKIGIRALSEKEMSVLLMTLAVDWKLGGGKPLGLGHCQVQKVEFVDENGKTQMLMERKGEEMALPSAFAENVEQYAERVKLYQKSQIPVEKLRYPRAVGKNSHDVRREGLQWFSRHATPKKDGNGNGHGLQGLYMIDGRTFAGQVLPELSLNGDDSLYGYDLIPVGEIRKTKDKRTLHESFEPFDENKNYMPSNRAPNTSPNANTRQGNRDKRLKR